MKSVECQVGQFIIIFRIAQRTHTHIHTSFAAAYTPHPFNHFLSIFHSRKSRMWLYPQRATTVLYRPQIRRSSAHSASTYSFGKTICEDGKLKKITGSAQDWSPDHSHRNMIYGHFVAPTICLVDPSEEFLWAYVGLGIVQAYLVCLKIKSFAFAW